MRQRFFDFDEADAVVDLEPRADMPWQTFSFADLFAGIGGIRLGFESIGGHCVFSSEFDEDACMTSENGLLLSL